MINHENIISTDLFHLSVPDRAFYVPWSLDNIEVIVDTLASLGVVHRKSEILGAHDTFKIEEGIKPSEDLNEVVERIFEGAKGIDTFRISDLGKEFVEAVSA